MQVLPLRSELTDLAGHSHAFTMAWTREAMQTTPRIRMSHVSNLATGDRQKATVAAFPIIFNQAGSLPRLKLNCAVNEIKLRGHARK